MKIIEYITKGELQMDLIEYNKPSNFNVGDVVAAWNDTDDGIDYYLISGLSDYRQKDYYCSTFMGSTNYGETLDQVGTVFNCKNDTAKSSKELIAKMRQGYDHVAKVNTKLTIL